MGCLYGKKYPGREAVPVGGIFFPFFLLRFFNPSKWGIFITRLKRGEKSYWFLIVNRDGCCESKNYSSGNSYNNDVNVFVDWPYVWVIASLETKWSRLKAILCFIFCKNETTVISKKNSEKLEISIVKREAAGIFVVGMMFSGEIYDKSF